MLIDQLIQDPINTLKRLTEKEIVQILEEADNAFFNTDESLFTDDIYDMVKNYLRQIDPQNAYLKKVGAPIILNKEKLPFYMGSLDKIKDNEAEIVKWQTKYKGSYVISEKLDGISCLLYNFNKTIQLFTRGDGTYGQNISHILSHININIAKIPNKMAIRGELIISRENWKLISHLGSNARNVVAGAVHSKTPNLEILSKIDLVAYDVLFPKNILSKSLEILKTLQVNTVKYELVNTLTLEFLSNLLQKWRKTSEYEIDGIVVHHNEEHKLIAGKNPKYAFAFKTILTHEQAEVIVQDVEWNVSKHRYLKPLVKFNEVVLAGVKIKQATGFNAAFIESNKIGPGSHIIIIRSGDVIPHIISVLTPSSNGKPKMPEVQYMWNETRVDIVLSGEEKNRDQDIQAFTHFMKTLDVDGVKEGVVTKLYDAGYDSLLKIINISLEDLKTIEGFQERSANKTIDSLKKISNVSCDKLLTASNIFGRGFGEKKIKMITDVFPYIATDKSKALKVKIDDLLAIKGIAKTTAKQFIEGLPKYFKFYEELGIKCTKTIPDEPNKSDIFKDKKIVFSGFRSKELETLLEQHGAKIMSTISKTTDLLIVKDKSEESTKIEKAKELGIQIVAKDEINL